MAISNLKEKIKIAIAKHLVAKAIKNIAKNKDGKPVHWASLTGFILGIIAFFFVGGGLLAIIFSAIGLGKSGPNKEKSGQGFAIAGLIMGILGLIITIILLA